MSDEFEDNVFDEDENQMDPALMGVCANLINFPLESSPTRVYMVGNMIPKSVVTDGRSERKMVNGFEYQYAETARRIEAPSNMVIEGIFYVASTNPGEMTDKWNSIFLVYKNDERNMYDVLELPRYNTQNTYIGFEYVYDKDVMRKLELGATFPKGTVFAKSPRISESGEWCFGMDLKVAPASYHTTEEDGIVITESCAREKLRCMFQHERKFSWNEDEYIPLMLYGTDDNPKPFPESGERVRPDGIVMGFRRRVSENALVSLTKKALRTPDLTHDILFVVPSPKDCEVMSVEVTSERMKNRANNRSTDYIEQQHNVMLDRYERKQNDMWNSVLRWYNGKIAANRGNDIAVTEALDTFIRSAMANYTRHGTTGKINPLFRAIKHVRLKDWNITITLKQTVLGRVKFKVSGMNGDKGVVVLIIPDDHAPCYPDGTRAEIMVNNTPAFRRQIYSMLIEQSVNFINVNVHKEVVAARKLGDYEGAWNKLVKFYETGFPEFAEIVRNVIVTEEDKIEQIDHVARTQISVHVRSDTKMHGVALIKALREVYSYKAERVTFVNALGERVQSVNPILITNQHFMLLDKFGTDMSAQSLPMANLFGMPAKLNETNKYSSFIRNVGNRNSGEPDTRLKTSQMDSKEVTKQLTLAYSPEVRKMVTKRIIRADDPFKIGQIVKESEYKSNRAVRMAQGMLSDSGYGLRRERPSDRTDNEE